MSSVTIEQIGVALALIVGIIGSVKYIATDVNKFLENKINTITSNLENQISEVKDSIAYLDEGQCKNYMSRYLKDVENGEIMDETETERFWEIYDHYTKPKSEGGLGLNSYFHKKVESLQKQGKL